MIDRFGQHALTRRIFIDVRFAGDEYSYEAEDVTLNLHGAGTYHPETFLVENIKTNFQLLWAKVALEDDSKLIPKAQITKQNLLALVRLP